MTAAAAVGGWVAAGLMAGVALLARRAVGGRMEAVARACHELRGPLAAVRLGLELGSRRGELSAARLRAIEAELGRAWLALDDLAGVRSGRRPELGLEPVDLRRLLEDSVEAWRPSASAVGGRLELRWLGGEQLVTGDRIRLAQASGNLIANAIEHGGGEVQVRGTVARWGARIEVVDRGPGLPGALAELTRRPRSPRRSRGRGLAIAAAVAAAHGGRLFAAPSPGGARLVLELPSGG